LALTIRVWHFHHHQFFAVDEDLFHRLSPVCLFPSPDPIFNFGRAMARRTGSVFSEKTLQSNSQVRGNSKPLAFFDFPNWRQGANFRVFRKRRSQGFRRPEACRPLLTVAEFDRLVAGGWLAWGVAAFPRGFLKPPSDWVCGRSGRALARLIRLFLNFQTLGLGSQKPLRRVLRLP
jgi:hypothetical protein